MISIKPVECNLRCPNCYELVARAFAPASRCDADKIIGAIKEFHKKSPERGHPPCLHGGEPLMLPIGDLEKFLAAIFDLYGRTSIQTNATLLDSRHFELFKKYKTSVGVSLDGDTPELNRSRGGDLAAIIGNIKRLRDEALAPSLLVTLWAANASAEKFESFKDFILRAEASWGVSSFRFLEGVSYERQEMELSPDALFEAHKRLFDLCDSGRRWSPYREIVDMMLGNFDVVCVFQGCDPWATSSEQPVFADGSQGNCLRTGASADGVLSLRADRESKLRSDVLHDLGQRWRGCKHCRYWPLCMGGCPGSAFSGDWRNKTRFCGAHRNLFWHVEKKIKSLFPNIYLSQDLKKRAAAATILSSIERSTYKFEGRRNIKELREKEEKAKAQAGKFYHGDSDDPEWRRQNPWWPRRGKK